MGLEFGPQGSERAGKRHPAAKIADATRNERVGIVCQRAGLWTEAGFQRIADQVSESFRGGCHDRRASAQCHAPGEIDCERFVLLQFPEWDSLTSRDDDGVVQTGTVVRSAGEDQYTSRVPSQNIQQRDSHYREMRCQSDCRLECWSAEA